MPRSVKEWIAKHDDQAIPTSVQLRVYDRHGGGCAECGNRVLPMAIDHIVPLSAGGRHRESNLQPLCNYHHKLKTAREATERAKVNRVKAKHIGVKKPSRFRGWRNFKGEIVWNDKR